MTVTREDIEGSEKTPEQIAEEKEAARQEELEAEREARHKAELDKAKAEGEAEALRRGIKTDGPPPQTEISEAQWQAMEAESGLDRKAIQANAKLTSALLQNLTKPLTDRAEAAEKIAVESREEVRKLKVGKSVEKVESEFYSKNPGLSAHRRDIDDFMGMLPESVKEDPKQFAAALEKAKTFVRGKAREDLSLRRTGKISSTNTERAEFEEGGDKDQEQVELDTSDLDNEGAKSLIERLHKNPGPDNLGPDVKSLAELPIEEAYKKSERSDKRGVSIDERADWKRGEMQTNRALREASKK